MGLMWRSYGEIVNKNLLVTIRNNATATFLHVIILRKGFTQAHFDLE